LNGNVFKWILEASQIYRDLKRTENNAAKEATAILKRLDGSKVEDQKW
jgi:hypothetical protein